MDILTNCYYVRYEGEFYERKSTTLPPYDVKWTKWDSDKEEYGLEVKDEDKVDELESTFREEFESKQS